ncbi:inhibitor of growth protein 5-like [Clavelina lepadiformis]|uniref:Inhibitor of growth protein n=1 Tax=Clavelina lepadiformis TaxID=159417 RepID=A0ABP0F371_CLALP
MATAMYLEQYLDSLETLPFELQRNFQLMRQLDQRSEDLKVDIDEMTESYVSEAKSLPPNDRVKKIKKIQESYAKCREFADDKVQLAMQTYEMVDKHIRRLDSDLARFEADLKEKSIQDAAGTSKVESETTLNDKRGRGRKKGRVASDDESKSSKKKQKTVESLLSVPLSSAYQSCTDVLDMPVDPNEPTYCLCHQVSYGEMIGCDNQDCPIEWFHFGCVNLTSKPKGKWYCPKCREDRDRKKK